MSATYRPLDLYLEACRCYDAIATAFYAEPEFTARADRLLGALVRAYSRELRRMVIPF